MNARENDIPSFKWKLGWTKRRLKKYVFSWPKRWTFLIQHFGPNKYGYRWMFWLWGLTLKIFDLIGVGDFYDIMTLWMKKYARPLTEREKEVAKTIFVNGPDLDMVIIDPAARFATKKFKIIYVSFYTINSWGAISDPILIHELMHVWQYEKFGTAYIALALQAQYSEARYNYGGVPAMVRLQHRPFSQAFNFEQQADLIEDYYRSKNKLPLQWSNPGTITDYWLSVWARARLTE